MDTELSSEVVKQRQKLSQCLLDSEALSIQQLSKAQDLTAHRDWFLTLLKQAKKLQEARDEDWTRKRARLIAPVLGNWITAKLSELMLEILLKMSFNRFICLDAISHVGNEALDNFLYHFITYASENQDSYARDPHMAKELP